MDGNYGQKIQTLHAKWFEVMLMPKGGCIG